MKKRTYEVGYGRPPKDTQFQPGQSGNLKGRPKGSRNVSTDLADELSEKILVNEGARQQKVSKQRAVIKSMLAKALKGDVRAARLLLDLQMSWELARSARTNDETPLDEADREILEAFAQRLAEQNKEDLQ